MFFNKQSENEFLSDLESELIKLQNKKEAHSKNNTKYKILSYLNKAANILNENNLKKEAQLILMVSKKLDDPATEGLTSEKMLENLKNKGWVFNVDDVDNTYDEDDKRFTQEEEIE